MNDKEIEKIESGKTSNFFNPRLVTRTENDDDDNNTAISDAISLRIETLDDKIIWLQTKFNMTDSEVSKAILRHTALLGGSTDTIEKKLIWMQERLELNDKQLNQLILRNPQINVSSIEQNPSPKLIWVEKKLNIFTTKELRRFVLLAPKMMNMNHDTLENKLNWYMDRFSFDNSEKTIQKALRKSPQLLERDVMTIDKKLTWLKRQLDLTDIEFSNIFQRYPNIVVFLQHRK